jgi:hypothetical protein
MAKKNYTAKLWGIGLIVLAFLVFAFRPFQDCAWYNLICLGASMTVTLIFGIISLVLLISGVVIILRK